MDWVRSRSDLSTADPHSVNMGGYPGIAIDVSVSAGCADSPDSAALFFSGQDVYGLDQGHTLRLVAVSVRGTTVSFMLDTPTADLDAFIKLCQPILDSISFPTS